MVKVDAISNWPEIRRSYPTALRTSYCQGECFKEWKRKYDGHLLFCDKMSSSLQVPHSGPQKQCWFFHELFLGTQYLDAGYEVLFFYRFVEDPKCYEKAEELLGGYKAAQFITPNGEKGGRAPDLLVFDARTNQFRFVECKGQNERFTPNQKQRFTSIETYLNQNLPSGSEPLADLHNEGLFPKLSTGQWIHIARLVPSRESKL